MADEGGGDKSKFGDKETDSPNIDEVKRGCTDCICFILFVVRIPRRAPCLLCPSNPAATPCPRLLISQRIHAHAHKPVVVGARACIFPSAWATCEVSPASSRVAPQKTRARRRAPEPGGDARLKKWQPSTAPGSCTETTASYSSVREHDAHGVRAEKAALSQCRWAVKVSSIRLFDLADPQPSVQLMWIAWIMVAMMAVTDGCPDNCNNPMKLVYGFDTNGSAFSPLLPCPDLPCPFLPLSLPPLLSLPVLPPHKLWCCPLVPC
jgi:hypothetical protein